MTAFMLGAYNDRVEILSDGAVYSPEGLLLGSACKVITSEVVPLAIVGSGAVAETALLAGTIIAAVEATGSVDQTLKILAATLAGVGETSKGDTGLRMAIGAISETSGPVCYVFSTFAEEGNPAFQLRRMPRVFAQGATPTGEELLAYGDLSIADGLERDAVFLFESMRRQKMTNPAAPDREPFYSVGAHIDLTVIRADGYEQRRLHEWPDSVGAKIDPHAGIPHSDGTFFSDGTGYE